LAGELFYRNNYFLYYWEGCGIFKKISISISHLPTFFLVIGYPVYWLELYFLESSSGKTTFMAPVFFIFIVSIALFCRFKKNILLLEKIINFLRALKLSEKILIGTGLFLCFLILGIAFYASLLPPHLVQEFDALNYHITLPRQHLIENSFAHLPWSAADFYLMPVQYALTPFWLCTEFPNKIPQFIFLIGLLSVSAKLAYRFGNNKILNGILVLFAIVGSHNFSIQMGTAMLDIVLCYLFIASLDSFFHGSKLLGMIELAFLFWAKPFLPIQIGAIFILLVLVSLTLKAVGFQLRGYAYEKIKEIVPTKRAIIKGMSIFFVLSLFIAGPFIFKSIYYTGTPLYPLSPGTIRINQNIDYGSMQWRSIVDVSTRSMAAKDAYGYGRSWIDFIKHFWLISVPDQGVNNRFDYPVGLPYLLFVGPFLYFFIISLKQKELRLIPFFIVLYWISWWLGIQQTRFLYIPIVLIFIYVASEFPRRSGVMGLCLIFSLSFTLLSIFRNYRGDFLKSKYDVLRSTDKELLAKSEEVGQGEVVDLDFPDAAFADFKINVREGSALFVLNQ